MSVIFKSVAIEPHRALADAVKAGCKVEGAVISEVDPHNTYNTTLPEGWTKESVNALAKHNNNFLQGCRVATAELSVDIFKADPTVNTVNAELGFFAKGDTISFRIDRERTFANPKASQEGASADTPATVTKQLVMTTTVKHRGQTGKTLRDALSEEYSSMFKR